MPIPSAFFKYEESIRFSVDGLTLSGVISRPVRSCSAAVIGCHGLLSNKSSPKQIELARQLGKLNMAYFRFDHRGCGESDGLLATDTTLENRRIDLLGAVGIVRDLLGKNLPIGLFGSSLGGTVCLSAWDAVQPFAIATLAAPMRSRAIHLPEDSPPSLVQDITETSLRFDLTRQIAAISNLLVVHGSADETVDTQNAHWIYDCANDPKSLVILQGADHRISQIAHQHRFMKKTVHWFYDAYLNHLEKETK